MCRIEVDPESLAELGHRLALAARAAADVRTSAGRASMRLSAAECGSDHLAAAAAAFLDGWGYGCGHLSGDAKTLADLLTRAGTVYLDVESTIAGVGR